VGEVGGAVEGVDIPAEFAGIIAQAAFFAEDGVGGEVVAEALDDELFAGAVGLGDEIVIAFQVERNAAFEVVRQQGARFAGDLRGGFQVASHD